MTQRVDVAPLTDDELAELGPLYDADLSPYLPPESGPLRLDVYTDERYERYAIRAEGELAGFAILSRGEAFRDPAELVWWMDEFFVHPRFRRRGVGAHSATFLFDAHRGTWEVGQLAANAPATSFWRDVIGRYTNGRFEEIQMDDERWRGPVQYFVSA